MARRVDVAPWEILQRSVRAPPPRELEQLITTLLEVVDHIEDATRDQKEHSWAKRSRALQSPSSEGARALVADSANRYKIARGEAMECAAWTLPRRRARARGSPPIRQLAGDTGAMRSWWYVALAACYRPSPPEGAPCANGIDCPAPLVCDRGVCVRDPLEDASIEIDAAPPTGCVPMWLAGSVTTSPVPAPNINSPATDVTPTITSDGATMYFSSTRDDPNAEIYRATRIGTTFTNVTVVPDLSSPAADGMVSISADGRSAFVSTERAGAPAAGRNYWEATRASTTDTFGNFTTAPFVNVNSAGNEFEIWASPDRLRIYVSSSGNTDQTIAIATRTSAAAPFGTPTVLPELDGPATECCLALSSDERVIVFRTGANETLYATRSSPTGTFSTPRLVPGAAPPNGVNLHMALSPDACTLYFSTTRAGGVGGFDIWTAGIGNGP